MDPLALQIPGVPIVGRPTIIVRRNLQCRYVGSPGLSTLAGECPDRSPLLSLITVAPIARNVKRFVGRIHGEILA